MRNRFPGGMAASCLAIWAALALTAFGGPSLTVTDLKGRSIEIELVSLEGDSVKFRRPGNPKDFTLAISQLDEASQKQVRTQAATLPPEKAKIKVDVIIGKRRSDVKDDYYMEKQEITCTVKLSNLSTTISVPAVTGKIVFIGQSTSQKEVFTVLSTQSFEASMKPSETVAKETESFVTSYDSDKKGAGNAGGFKYFGYLLAIMDGSGNLILDQTTSGPIRQALDSKETLLQKVLGYSKGTKLDSKMEPPSK
jgi:hypothetical protein